MADGVAEHPVQRDIRKRPCRRAMRISPSTSPCVPGNQAGSSLPRQSSLRFHRIGEQAVRFSSMARAWQPWRTCRPRRSSRNSVAVRLAHGTKTASVRLLDDSSSILRRWSASHACLRRPLGSTPFATVRGLGDGPHEVAAGLMQSRKKRGLATIQPGLASRPSPENRTVADRNRRVRIPSGQRRARDRIRGVSM